MPPPEGAAEDSCPAPDTVPAAALAVVLGGYAGTHRAGPAPRTRRRFGMGSLLFSPPPEGCRP
jgi:hypothetical protein